MFEEFAELYTNAGEWGDPILLVTGALFAAGWVMLFTVRLIKKFILYSIVALVLPNSIGITGYVDNVDDLDELQESLVERGEEMSEEILESAENLTFSPIYLGLAGSILTLVLGIAGIIKTRRRKTKTQSTPS